MALTDFKCRKDWNTGHQWDGWWRPWCQPPLLLCLSPTKSCLFPTVSQKHLLVRKGYLCTCKTNEKGLYSVWIETYEARLKGHCKAWSHLGGPDVKLPVSSNKSSWDREDLAVTGVSCSITCISERTECEMELIGRSTKLKSWQSSMDPNTQFPNTRTILPHKESLLCLQPTFLYKDQNSLHDIPRKPSSLALSRLVQLQ